MEEDFRKAFSGEACDINGVGYRSFHWRLDFVEEEEPSTVSVWIFLPGLALNYYNSFMLLSITAPIGNYIRYDNATRCATRNDGARVYVEIDAAKSPLHSIWIGVPFAPGSRLQGLVYEETLPAY